MRVAALYDIHGNLPALEAVLAEARAAGVDQVVMGGDVFPGPLGREALELLLELDLPVHFIHGNGDRELLAIADGVETPWYRDAEEARRAPLRWCAGRLGDGHRDTLAAWPDTTRLAIPGLGELLFCHATPLSDTEIFTERTPDARLARLFAGVSADLVVCGHTHLQFECAIGGLRIVNAGSVGMPFGGKGAHWLLLGPGIEWRQTAYDGSAAAAGLNATDYPDVTGFVDRAVLAPPTRESMLERFAAADRE